MIRFTVAVLAVMCCGVIAGCVSRNDSTTQTVSETPTAAESAETSAESPADSTAGPTETASASPIDACALISAEDITNLLGVSVEGKSTTTDPEMPGCIWENPDTLESISLEIGNPGTAVDNTLPPPEPGFPEVGTPGPDGMRFLGGGQVEFAAGTRSNTVQVAVLKLSGDEANAAAVDLARKVTPQIPG